jgi:hypothetical protein
MYTSLTGHQLLYLRFDRLYITASLSLSDSIQTLPKRVAF